MLANTTAKISHSSVLSKTYCCISGVKSRIGFRRRSTKCEFLLGGSIESVITSSAISSSPCFATVAKFPTSNAATDGKTSRVSHSLLPPMTEKWDLYAGVCLERKPIVRKELTPLEKEYTSYLEQYEVELSKKSDTEVRAEKDVEILNKIKSGDMEQGTIETAQDYEDICSAELQKFNPQSRITDADKTNDFRSLDRALDSHLLLIVEQKLGNGYRWVMPHGKLKKGENLRQVTERTLEEFCPGIKTRVLGNAPWGFYKYKYPPGVKDDDGEILTGAKVFFYKAHILFSERQFTGNDPMKSNTASQDMKDFMWLTRRELESKLTPIYYKTITEFLIAEH